MVEWLQRSMSATHRKVDVRPPGKGNSTSQGARPVHKIISMIKWIRTSLLSINISLADTRPAMQGVGKMRVSINIKELQDKALGCSMLAEWAEALQVDSHLI